MMIQSFRSKLEYYSLQELMNDIIETTGYVKELQESDEEDAEDRIQNIDELVSKVVAYEDSHDDPSLSEFLEEVALVADIDGVDAEDNRVLLMTLHSAKGLEFPHVYLAGLEDGVFPSYMTITSDDPSAVEEERRLAYVGITRAKEDLTITCAKQRMLRGETQYNPVSRFVREVPGELLDNKPQIFKKKTDFEEYRETPESRARFQTALMAAIMRARLPGSGLAAESCGKAQTDRSGKQALHCPGHRKPGRSSRTEQGGRNQTGQFGIRYW